MSCFLRLTLCIAACFAISNSISAADLCPGPIQVDPSIPYPEKMTFIGLSQSIILGASLGLGASVATRGAVKEYVRNAASQRRNLTPVPVYVREEFSDVVPGFGFSPDNDSATDKRFRLAVRKYGFGQAEMLSRQVRPLMTLYAEMVTPDGKILWAHESAVKSDDKTLPSVLPEDLRNNPEEQERLLRIAAHRASERVMENYQQKQSNQKPGTK